MTRKQLEQHLGKKVEITLFCGDIIKGVLHKTGEECFKGEPNLYIPKNRYFCTNNNSNVSCVFRCSHVVKLR